MTKRDCRRVKKIIKKQQYDGGCGCGLMVCKQICLQCNGDIDFKSDEGKGSKFTCSLFVEEELNGSRAEIESIDISFE